LSRNGNAICAFNVGFGVDVGSFFDLAVKPVVAEATRMVKTMRLKTVGLISTTINRHSLKSRVLEKKMAAHREDGTRHALAFPTFRVSVGVLGGAQELSRCVAGLDCDGNVGRAGDSKRDGVRPWRYRGEKDGTQGCPQTSVGGEDAVAA